MPNASPVPDRLARRFRVLLEAASVALTAALVLVVVAGVGFRKAGASLVWYDEVASILLVWLTYYGSCLVALDRGHIGFPNLVRAAPARFAGLLVAARETVVIGFFLVVAWAGWRVLLVLEGTYLISLPWVPTRLTQSVIPVSAVLFILAELLSVTARGEAELSPEDDTGR
jgi:TRAP-type C4-dicarboxylate transport system permease small subunit